MRRLVYRAAGVVCVALGVAGLFLPLLPTTPFVLLAAAAFARSSPELHEALRRHPQLGPRLRDWERYGAIPRSAKIATVVLMSVSFLLVLLVSHNWWVPAIAGGVMLCSGLFVVTRPSPPRGADEPG